MKFMFMALAGKQPASFEFTCSSASRIVHCLLLSFFIVACSSEATEDQLLERARLSMDHGDIRAAMIDVKTALQRNPDSAYSRKTLAEIYLFQQNPDAAVDELERALSMRMDEDALTLYAIALIKSGKDDVLLEKVDAGIFRSVETAPHYLTALALAQAAHHDVAAAEQSLGLAASKAPDDPYVTTSDAFFQLRYGGALEKARATLTKTVQLHPDYAQAWSLLGDIQHVSGESALAERSYLKASEINPYRLSDRLGMVSAKLAQGKIDEAASDIARLEAGNPDHPGVVYARGRQLLSAGDTRGALESFNKVLGALPSHPGSLYLAGVANGLEGNLSSALGQLERFVTLHPHDINGLLQLASLHLRMNRPAAAESVAMEILELNGRNNHAREILDAALTAQGRNSVALADSSVSPDGKEERNETLLQQSDLTRFVSLTTSNNGKQTLKINPDNAAALATAARVELQRGEAEKAEVYLQQALELEPKNTDLRKLLAEALAGQRKFEDAQSMLASLPEPVASEPEVLVAKGRIALARQQPVAAERHLRKAIMAQPSTLTLLWLSEAVANQGNEPAALKLLEDWLAHTPGDLRVRDRLAYSYLNVGREREASEHYQVMLEQSPDNVRVLNNLAWLLRRESGTRALAYIEKANALAPDNPQVLDTYAMIQLELGETQKALSMNQRSLELSPDDPQILYHRSLILLGAGRVEEAALILQDLVSVPGFTEKKKAQYLLDELQRAPKVSAAL